MAVAGESRNMVVDAIVSWPMITVIEIQSVPVAARRFKDWSVPGAVYKPYLGASKDFQSPKFIPFLKASRGGRGRVWVGVGGAGGFVGLGDVNDGVVVKGTEEGAVDGGASEVGDSSVGEDVGVIVGVVAVVGVDSVTSAGVIACSATGAGGVLGAGTHYWYRSEQTDKD